MSISGWGRDSCRICLRCLLLLLLSLWLQSAKLQEHRSGYSAPYTPLQLFPKEENTKPIEPRKLI